MLWKKSAPYNFKCRKVIQIPGERHALAEAAVRLMLPSQWVNGCYKGHYFSTLTAADGHPAGKPQPMEESTPDMADGTMTDDAAARERVLKFEVQMYRLREGEYVVDFQVNWENWEIACSDRTVHVCHGCQPVTRHLLRHGKVCCMAAVSAVCLCSDMM